MGGVAAVGLFVRRIRPLSETLAVVLWQLPPALEVDIGLLDSFLAGLPDDILLAVEVRHPSWIAEEVFETIAAHGVAWVAVSSQAFPPVRRRTAPFV